MPHIDSRHTERIREDGAICDVDIVNVIPHEGVATTGVIVEEPRVYVPPVPEPRVIYNPPVYEREIIHEVAPIVEPPMERAVVRPVIIEMPKPEPKEEVFIQPVHLPREPVVIERPKIEMEFNPRVPGLIFGLDEEVDLETCFYEEIEYLMQPEVEDIVEEAVVNTPYGPRRVRSPAFHHMVRPPLEHDEILKKCVHKTLIAPTAEIGVRLPQVRYVTLEQASTGTFEWPVVRRAQVLPGKTIEKTVEIPQLGFVDLCQDHPTNEYPVAIPQVHTVAVFQIVETTECEVDLPIVHTIWIPVMGDVNILQHRTKSRRVYLKQEWDCTIKCEDTRVHFLQLPQRESGISGTVVRNGQDDDTNTCHSCHTSKCAGVGPAFLPLLVGESNALAATAEVQTKYIEVIKEVPIPCPEVPVAAVVPVASEPTEIHHVKLGMCPCKAVAINEPVMFAEAGEGAAAAAFPWWLLPLLMLLLLLLAMLLAWLLCWHRRRKEVVAAPIKHESPKKKFVIEKRTKEEDEQEIEREIARQLEQRVQANRRDQPGGQVQPQAQPQAQAAAPPKEERKVEAQAQSRAPVPEPAATSAAATLAAAASQAQQRPASPGGSQGSADRQRSSRGSGSSKKVVKKRIVKMMKQGKLVAEKEEILDEEGNVIRTEIRKEGLSSASPSRSQH